MENFDLKAFDCGESYDEIHYTSENDELDDVNYDSDYETLYDENEYEYTYELPYELQYNFNFEKPRFQVDENKLLYQNLYRTYEFYEKRYGLGDGLSYVDGSKEIIQNMANSASLPLEDLEYIKMNTNIIQDEQN